MFNENLKLIRKKMGLNQGDFGKPLGITGSSISSIERGLSKPSNSVLKLIEIKYQISRNWLFTGEGDPYIKVQEGNKGAESDASIYKVGETAGEDPEIVELLTMTRDVLKSKTDYTRDLAVIVRSFHQAVQSEKRLDEFEDRLGRIEEEKKIYKEKESRIRESDNDARRGEILKKRKA